MCSTLVFDSGADPPWTCTVDTGTKFLHLRYYPFAHMTRIFRSLSSRSPVNAAASPAGPGGKNLTRHSTLPYTDPPGAAGSDYRSLLHFTL